MVWLFFSRDVWQRYSHTAMRAVYPYVHALKSMQTISCTTAPVERCLSKWRCYKYTCWLTV